MHGQVLPASASCNLGLTIGPKPPWRGLFYNLAVPVDFLCRNKLTSAIFPILHPRSFTRHIHTNYFVMATNGSNGTNGANGANGAKKGTDRFDPNFTDHVIGLMSPETKPRDREILTSLIRHMHDFCREVELTQEEWVIGVNYVNSVGQAYQKNRNEAWRVCDILGIES